MKDKAVLITGGTGTFGRAMARRLLQDDLCAKVIVLSRDEWKQWEMEQSDPIFRHPKIRFFLGDVRDSQRLARAFKDVQIVIHAAALKQVPAAEYNPSEVIKTNIQGAMNVIDNAIERGVEKVIALSTDKAVNPINLYGATKLCADKLFISGNAYVGSKGRPSFSVVRYGNVLGSRGSIIPLWKQKVAEGAKELMVTDERMTRFWITVDQTVDFVLYSLDVMRGVEIFVPKIPSLKIVDLAKAIAPQLPIKICGIREGEKIHEWLVSAEEARFGFETEKSYILLPPFYKRHLDQRKAQLPRGFQPLPEGFIYSSDTNSQQLTIQEVRAETCN